MSIIGGGGHSMITEKDVSCGIGLFIRYTDLFHQAYGESHEGWSVRCPLRVGAPAKLESSQGKLWHEEDQIRYQLELKGPGTYKRGGFLASSITLRKGETHDTGGVGAAEVLRMFDFNSGLNLLPQTIADL